MVDVIIPTWEKTPRGREYHKQYARDYYRKNRDRMSAEAVADKREKRWQIIALLGGSCVRCGFDDARALQVDHVNGNGAEERRAIGSGTHRLLREVKENAERYQLLCANCNWIKRHERGEHGPKRRLPDWQP